MNGRRSLRGPGVTWAVALALGLALSAPAGAYLTYTLSSELKKSGCSGDTDSDCLSNVEEGNLAWAVAPWYFYDEDEGCSGWRNEFGLPAFHFARQDFFQVRPQGGGVGNWSPTDGQAKWIRLSYFFVFPHDCRSTVGFGGHQGDTEHIKVELYSYDLRTWYLYRAYYAHHDQDHYFSGTYLEDRARSLGTSWISVAADEDSHGSWPGRSPDSTHCAGSEDEFCFSTCDCFVGTWRNALNSGAGREVVGVSRNIGGPPPETWNASVLTVSGGQAYTELDVGHGLNREYWTPRSDQFQKHCGWECPTASRRSDGTCSLTVHGRTGCSSQLSTKVDTTSFSLAAAGFFGGAAASTQPSSTPTVDPAASTRAARAVEATLPSLRGVPPEEQLRSLRWMLSVGDDRRLVSLFPDLQEKIEESLDERGAAARQRLEELAGDLERAGHLAPAPEDEVARIDPNAPPPNHFPPAMILDLELRPEDPEAVRELEETRPPGR